MRPLRTILLALLLTGPAFGQGSVLVLDLGNNTQIALVTLPSGETVVIPNVTIFKVPPPSPPQPQSQWKVTGLHVLIVDDENVRGNLPQSQVNIFSSRPLRDWLNQNAKYRFSSNDSLRPGQPARELEQAAFVNGWDLVAEGGVELPAILVSNGTKQTLEPLPADADATITLLEGFK